MAHSPSVPRTCVVIPARMASTRLPGKMLLAETGRSLVEHTHAAALQAKLPQAVIVATDHPAIAEEVTRFGGQAMMTSPDHPSGTDRLAEVAAAHPEFDLWVNLQGDEPEVDPQSIDHLIELLAADPSAPMATLAARMTEAERIVDPANVKVVFDTDGRALYFSRSPIPYARDAGGVSDEVAYYHHVGMYAYRRDFLLQLGQMEPTPLEQAERLEQLRVLEQGQAIRVGLVAQAAAGIDTPGDYAAFVARTESLARRAA